MAQRPRRLAPLAAALVLAALLPEPAAATDVAHLVAFLPEGRDSAAAVWAGSAAYVFGGFRECTGPECETAPEGPGQQTPPIFLNDIVRFTPEAGAQRVGSLLQSHFAMGAVWTGSAAYLLGGSSWRGAEGVFRFDPGSGQVTEVLRHLPVDMEFPGAAWKSQGSVVYLAGGGTDRIVRFDPATGRAILKFAHLPTVLHGASAVSDGAYVYIFGGHDGTSLKDTILRFDPVSDSVTTLPIRLPTPRSGTNAVWALGAAWVLGGTCPSEVVRVDVAAFRVERMGATLPRICTRMAAATDGSAAVLFGGSGGDGSSYSRDIVAVPLREDHPHAVLAPVADQECDAGGARVTLDGSGSTDPLGRPLGFAWSATGVALDDPGSAQPTGTFPLGDTRVRLVVRSEGGWDGAMVTVRVRDTLPPTVAWTRPEEGHIYVEDADQGSSAPIPPPGRAMALGPLTLRASAEDACALGSVVLEVRTQDGRSLGAANLTAPPFELRFEPTVSDSGVLEAVVQAWDHENRTATSSLLYWHKGQRCC